MNEEVLIIPPQILMRQESEGVIKGKEFYIAADFPPKVFSGSAALLRLNICR